MGPKPVGTPAAAATTSAAATSPSSGGPPRKKRRRKVLDFAERYLEQLPSAAMYERSYMHRDVVTHVAVAARPNFVITASRDGQVKFWKKTNAGIEFVKHFRAHLGAVTDMAVSPTGAYLATLGAEDKSVKVFDVATFDMIAQVSTAGYTAALCCWVSDRDPILAISDADSGKVHVYDPLSEASAARALL